MKQSLDYKEQKIKRNVRSGEKTDWLINWPFEEQSDSKTGLRRTGMAENIEEHKDKWLHSM